jgi:tRNA/tmRNA/rRNA uracil-C5-methylase (TrmA/RlmC/RlmD family)
MIVQNKRSTRASGLLMSNTLNYNRWQLEIFGQELGEKVLELGCGVGNITLILSQKATKIYALEINPGAIELAREKLKDRPNVEFV